MKTHWLVRVDSPLRTFSRAVVACLCTLLFFAILFGHASAQVKCEKEPDGLCPEQRLNQQKLRAQLWHERQFRNGKIIKGDDARDGQFPWMVAIGETKDSTGRGYFCGGTMIADSWVLSAAHCFRNITHDDTWPIGQTFSVRVGHITLGNFQQEGVPVKRVMLPSIYTSACNGQDFALLELQQAVKLPAGNVWPLLAGAEDEFVEGYNYTIMGFGTTQEGGPESYKLKWSKVPALSTDNCRTMTDSDNKPIYGDAVKDDMICAGKTNDANAADACKGDSGGGMLLQGDNRNVLVGIVSWGGLPVNGKVCATGQICSRDPFRVGVYTRVSTYKTEIEACLKGENKCDTYFTPW
jgi:secreted trypsin-like serine protease